MSSARAQYLSHVYLNSLLQGCPVVSPVMRPNDGRPMVEGDAPQSCLKIPVWGFDLRSDSEQQISCELVSNATGQKRGQLGNLHAWESKPF